MIEGVPSGRVDEVWQSEQGSRSERPIMLRRMPSFALRRLVLLTIGLALAGSGCASPVGGAATAAAPSQRLQLDGVDPCATLTADQTRALGLGVGEPQQNVRSDLHTCIWSGPHGLYQVTTLTANALDDVRRINPDPVDGVLEGRPTVQTPGLGARPGQACQLYVEVAPEQVVHAGFQSLESRPPASEVSCAAVATMARAVLATLAAR